MAKRIWKTGVLATATALVAVTAVIATTSRTADATITVYKSPTCGCCSKWVDHLRAAGFDVETSDVDNLGPVKAHFGVGRELASCHTAVIGDYVIEGHVPADVIGRLLAERPAVKGLAVPGMPVGSPGMEGSYREPYSILAFDERGQTSVYERR